MGAVPWEEPDPEDAFDGGTYEANEDFARLNRQQRLVYEALTIRPGWWTLRELADATGASEASVSARLRDLRKVRYGSHTVERQRVTGGLYVYRLAPREPAISA